MMISSLRNRWILQHEWRMTNDFDFLSHNIVINDQKLYFLRIDYSYTIILIFVWLVKEDQFKDVL